VFVVWCSSFQVLKYGEMLMAQSDNQLEGIKFLDFDSDSILAFYFSLRDENSLDNESIGGKSLLTVIEAGPRQPIEDLEENVVPLAIDPVEHITKRATVERPSSVGCHHLQQQINLELVSTNWISMATKLKEYANSFIDVVISTISFL
jgi:hypothetical protein